MKMKGSKSMAKYLAGGLGKCYEMSTKKHVEAMKKGGSAHGYRGSMETPKAG